MVRCQLINLQIEINTYILNLYKNFEESILLRLELFFNIFLHLELMVKSGNACPQKLDSEAMETYMVFDLWDICLDQVIFQT